MTRKPVKKNPAPRSRAAAALRDAAAVLDAAPPGAGTLLSLVPPELADDDDDDESEADEYSGLNRIMTELAGGGDAGGQVQVTRIDPNDPMPGYCFKCGANDFSLERVRADYGTGIYNVKIWAHRADRNGKYGLIYNQRHKIIGPAFAPAGTTGTLTRAEVETMLAARPVAAPVDPHAALDAQLELMAKLKAVMLPGSAAPAPVSPTSMLKEMMETFALFRGAAGEFTSFAGGGGKKSDMEILSDVAGPLVKTLADGMANRAPAQPAGPHFVPPVRPAPRLAAVPNIPPAPSPNPASPAAPLSADEEAKKMLSLTLAMLCDRAAKNADVVLCADFVLDGLSDDDFNSFGLMLDQANWFELLQAFHKPVENYKPWFTSLRQACLDSMLPPEGGKGDGGKGGAAAAA